MPIYVLILWFFEVIWKLVAYNNLVLWLRTQPTLRNFTIFSQKMKLRRSNSEIPSMNLTQLVCSKSQVMSIQFRLIQIGFFFDDLHFRRSLQVEKLWAFCTSPNKMCGHAGCTIFIIQLGKNILKDINRYWKMVIYGNLACCYHYTRKLSKCNKFCEKVKEELEKILA